MPDPATAALDYLIGRAQADPALLYDLLTPLAVAAAGQRESEALREHFEREFRLERGRLNLLRALPLAKRIKELRQ